MMDILKNIRAQRDSAEKTSNQGLNESYWRRINTALLLNAYVSSHRLYWHVPGLNALSAYVTRFNVTKKDFSYLSKN
jgi:hypothetical protein